MVFVINQFRNKKSVVFDEANNVVERPKNEASEEWGVFLRGWCAQLDRELERIKNRLEQLEQEKEKKHG